MRSVATNSSCPFKLYKSRTLPRAWGVSSGKSVCKKIRLCVLWLVMAEIRGRGRILASQLFLSTVEIANFRDANKCMAQNQATNCTNAETRMNQGFACIYFRGTL